jgi:hypothetical protein
MAPRSWRQAVAAHRVRRRLADAARTYAALARGLGVSEHDAVAAVRGEYST